MKDELVFVLTLGNSSEGIHFLLSLQQQCHFTLSLRHDIERSNYTAKERSHI